MAKLPAYFKDYLDTRFFSLEKELHGVRKEIKEIKQITNSLKKNIEKIDPQIKTNANQIKNIFIILGIIIVALLLHLGTTDSAELIKSIL